MPEKLLTPKQVAEWLDVSPAWVLDHASGRRRPYLPSVKLGKAVRFRREDVEQFIEDCLRLEQRLRASVMKWYRKDKPPTQEPMWEAIEESGWNAVALPIPVNASKELLIEMYNWTTSFVQIYLDDVRDHRCLSDPKPDDPKYLKAEERLKLASRRETQIEWRLNVMGLFHSNSRDWAPAADNEYVKETIERWPIPITDTICRLIENSI